MKQFYEALAGLLKKGESFAVATIFDKSGSAPRAEGAKMAVRADGSIIGTIGGGRLEAETIALARKTIPAGITVTQVFDLTSKDAAGSDMICGGAGEVLVDFIDAGDPDNLRIYSEAANIFAKGGRAWLITVLGKTAQGAGVPRGQCLVRADRTVIGSVDVGPYLLEKLIAGPAKITIHSEAFDEYRFLVEPLRQAGTVYLFGAGHVSQKIAPLAEQVGFKTVVIDDRDEYANMERFPDSGEVKVVADFKKLPDLGIDSDSYLVIVTRGHLYDKHVLAQVLRMGAAYVGMIGSRNKRELIYNEMVSNGFTREELTRVYSPIGTDIGAETPEEIAVSIVGELISVRADRTGKRKKNKGSTAAPCCEIKEV